MDGETRGTAEDSLVDAGDSEVRRVELFLGSGNKIGEPLLRAVLAEGVSSDIGGLRCCSTSVAACGPSGSGDGCVADRLLDSRLGDLVSARSGGTSGDRDAGDLRCRRCGR